MSKRDKAESMELLRDWLPAGSTIYCILRGVSGSGMTRWISFYAVVNGSMTRLDRYIEDVLDYAKWSDKHEGLRVGGVGMDMGFSVVYHLSSRLFEGQERAGYLLKYEWL